MSVVSHLLYVSDLLILAFNKGLFVLNFPLSSFSFLLLLFYFLNGLQRPKTGQKKVLCFAHISHLLAAETKESFTSLVSMHDCRYINETRWATISQGSDMVWLKWLTIAYTCSSSRFKNVSLICCAIAELLVKYVILSSIIRHVKILHCGMIPCGHIIRLIYNLKTAQALLDKMTIVPCQERNLFSFMQLYCEVYNIP